MLLTNPWRHRWRGGDVIAATKPTQYSCIVRPYRIVIISVGFLQCNENHTAISYIIYFAPAMETPHSGCELRSESLYVCLSVRSDVSNTTRPNFTKFSVHVSCGRGSVCLWRQCNTLCTSGFVYDVTFWRNGANIGQKQRRRAYVSSSSPDGDNSRTSDNVIWSSLPLDDTGAKSTVSKVWPAYT